jgi:mono/diheme cytochrome c family protein
MRLGTKKAPRNFKNYWLFAFVCSGLMIGCSKQNDHASELTPEQRWARPDVTWTTEQLQQLERGYQAYRGMCAACHLSEGQGQALVGAPALNKNSLLTANDNTDAIKLVLFGRNAMPSFAKSLNDEQLADILSYVRNAWDNRGNDTISAQHVNQIRDKPKG